MQAIYTAIHPIAQMVDKTHAFIKSIIPSYVHQVIQVDVCAGHVTIKEIFQNTLFLRFCGYGWERSRPFVPYELQNVQKENQTSVDGEVAATSTFYFIRTWNHYFGSSADYFLSENNLSWALCWDPKQHLIEDSWVFSDSGFVYMLSKYMERQKIECKEVLSAAIQGQELKYTKSIINQLTIPDNATPRAIYALERYLSEISFLDDAIDKKEEDIVLGYIDQNLDEKEVQNDDFVHPFFEASRT